MKTAKVIGCGLSGITAAILLKERGYNVEIFDKRDHVGGNCYDHKINNILVHRYGPHMFHTNDDEVFEFLSRYTTWIPFKNQPKGETRLGKISLPYSKKTINELGRELTQEEIIEYIFKDYSEKQWGVSFEEIPKSITNRIPKTKDCEDPTWYEGEKYQCLPRYGYTKMMENMLNGFKIYLGCTNEDWKNKKTDLTVYTGKIDEYFNYCHGELPYRSLDFKHTITDKNLECCIINQNNKTVKYTRKYDHSYFNLNPKGNTVITEEYPKKCEKGDIPFYPIPFGEGVNIYNQYKTMTENEKDVIFVGRLATYTYLDMWMAIKQVFLKFKNIK